MIRLESVSKIYGSGDIEVRALDGLSIAIDTGDLVAVTGPSGSGKSTLLNLLGCLDRPTTGSYRLADRDVSRLDDDDLAAVRNRFIGFVFQSFNLLPRKTALDNVALPLIYANVGRDERLERARERLEQVGLGDRTHHLPSQLSGGQNQRVAIARALVTRPKLILADEPTGNLDTHSSQEIMDVLTGLLSQGDLTVVIVTHDPTVAERCPRRLLIVDGRITKDEIH
ncbi:MAG: ABC transporter ATP-binding protein [Myxococcota bacterium]